MSVEDADTAVVKTEAVDEQTPEQAAQAAEQQVADDRVTAAEKNLADKGLLDQGTRDAGERDSVDTSEQHTEQTPKLTQRQREMAKQMGYSDEEVTQLGDKAVEFLDKSARNYDRTFTEQGEKSRELDEAIAAAKAGKVETGGKTGETGDGEQGETPTRRSTGKPGDFKGFVDEDGYLDTEKVAAWGVDVHQYVSSLEERVTKHEDMLATVLQQRETDQWDTFFDGLDPALYPQYGKGRTEELEEGSPERVARDKLEDEVKLHLRGAAFSKRTITLHQAQQRLLPAPDPESIREAEQRRISADLDRQSRMGLTRRGGRHGDAVSMTDQQKRDAHATENLRKKGLIDD